MAHGLGPTQDGTYRHWDTLRHLTPPNDLSSEEWWFALKTARQHLYQSLPTRDKSGEPFKYALLDGMLRMLHAIDKNASGALKGSDQVTNPQTRDTYLIKSLVEEAITSSQLEGASTTREVAKEMIRTGRRPRDRSEKMILNAYHAMMFIGRIKAEPLTPSIVLELQKLVTENTLRDPGAAGRLRREDEPIQIEDEIGTVLHVPPPASELVGRMEAMCKFANDNNAKQFIHPVIRAVVLHFWLAYDHPFVDGNGRTSRALFYWCMAREGYWLCEFLSISRILKKAPGKYNRAFLYTETDENDLTYFILNQVKVILRAIAELHDYLEKKAQEIRETETFLRRSTTLAQMLNYRQLALLNHALKNAHFRYTILSHRRSHNVSYQTARTDLLELSKYQLLDLGKKGKTFNFSAPADLKKRIERITVKSVAS